MNEKTISTVALRENHPDLHCVLREAADGVIASAALGADLVVLPETINLLHQAATSVPIDQLAVEDWREATAPLCDVAAKHGVGLVLPLLVRSGNALANRFYMLRRDGSEAGFYQKQTPAAGERLAGVSPSITQPIPWEGLRIGGGICIDVYFPHEIFEPQAQAGADLFILPSMTPAGTFLDTCAVNFGVPFVLAYSPWSRILDRDGRELAAGGFRSETLRAGFGSPVQHATINFNAVSLFADFNQQLLPQVLRHYGNRVRVRFDQTSCVFFLESRSADLDIREVMREFGLVSRRDYFAQLTPNTPHGTPE